MARRPVPAPEPLHAPCPPEECPLRPPQSSLEPLWKRDLALSQSRPGFGDLFNDTDETGTNPTTEGENRLPQVGGPSIEGGSTHETGAVQNISQASGPAEALMEENAPTDGVHNLLKSEHESEYGIPAISPMALDGDVFSPVSSTLDAMELDHSAYIHRPVQATGGKKRVRNSSRAGLNNLEPPRPAADIIEEMEPPGKRRLLLRGQSKPVDGSSSLFLQPNMGRLTIHTSQEEAYENSRTSSPQNLVVTLAPGTLPVIKVTAGSDVSLDLNTILKGIPLHAYLASRTGSYHPSPSLTSTSANSQEVQVTRSEGRDSSSGSSLKSLLARYTATRTRGVLPNVDPAWSFRSAPRTTKVGFLSLPGELQNQIYRAALMTTDPVHHSLDMSRSAQLLATCKQVYVDAAGILYGRHYFAFTRDFSTRRGRFFEPHKSAEIGYKDMQRFFMMIGPFNISLILELGISFQHAMCKVCEDEVAKYWSDDHLYWSLNQLAKHANLNNLILNFQGPRALRSDEEAQKQFVHMLCKIKCDRLEFGNPAAWRMDLEPGVQLVREEQKLSPQMRSKLETLMVRDRPYWEEVDVAPAPDTPVGVTLPF